MTCALFRALPSSAADPAEVLTYLNRHLCKVADPSFMTALYAVYDTNSATLKVARAGHPMPMIYRASEGKASEFVCDGVYPMGIEPYEQTVPITETTLEKGDRLLVYTDGLTERFNVDGSAYGEERLLQMLATNPIANPQEIIAAIMGDVEQFANGHPADDDQALLVGIVE
jgi:sigma-B regulation protein RsbU (phosphoserine phosphatase)